MRACSTPMDAPSTSDAARMGESGDPAVALLDKALFEPYLEPSEQILWVGRPGGSKGSMRRVPEKSKKERRAEAAGYVILIVILIGAYGTEVGSKHHDWSWSRSFLAATVTVGLMLVAMMALLFSMKLVLIAGRFARSPFHRQALNDSSYALTDLRAMALRRSQSGALRMSSYDSVNKPRAMLREDGSGNVIFGYKGGLFPRWGGRRTPNASCLVLENIDNAATVYRLAQVALEERALSKAQLMDAAP